MCWQPAFASAAHWDPETVEMDAKRAGGLEDTWHRACKCQLQRRRQEQRADLVGPRQAAVCLPVPSLSVTGSSGAAAVL